MRYKELLLNIKSDLKGHKFFSVKGLLFIMFNQPFRLILNYRIGKYLSESRNPVFRLWSRFLKNRQFRMWSCDISYHSRIGKKVIFGHPIGIVIGYDSVIEDNVRIWQNVTLGSHGKDGYEKSYPIVKSGTKIYAGAILIGGITIGENSVIAANAVVTESFPPNSIIGGIPAKLIKKRS